MRNTKTDIFGYDKMLPKVLNKALVQSALLLHHQDLNYYEEFMLITILI